MRIWIGLSAALFAAGNLAACATKYSVRDVMETEPARTMTISGTPADVAACTTDYLAIHDEVVPANPSVHTEGNDQLIVGVSTRVDAPLYVIRLAHDTASIHLSPGLVFKIDSLTEDLTKALRQCERAGT